MCGIVGYSGIEPAPNMDAALAAIAHRGPDQSGILIDQNWQTGLGHTRLSILDLSEAGRQPMSTQCGSFALAYNGEIYNYQELRAQLISEGHIFQSESDTEVLLQLLVTRGLEALPELNGIFTFAFFDRKNGRITLVRDRLGVKPLYVHEEDGEIRFASEVKAIKALDAKLSEVDHEALSQYLSFLWCPGIKTPATRLRRVAPGQALIIEKGRIQKTVYWAEVRSSCNKRQITSDAAETELREVIRAAVYRQMVSDVPVGAFLSGGLDSSAIVAFARERKPDIQCFTIDTGSSARDGDTEDLPFARRVADYLEVPLEVINVSSDDLISELNDMVCHLDEPLADPAALNVLFISRLARRHGCKVLLSGAGGDDILTGYRRHAAIRYRRYWSWLPVGVRKELARGGEKLDVSRPLLRRVVKLLGTLPHDGDAAVVSYFRWIGHEEVLQLFKPQLREKLSHKDPAMPLFEKLAGMSNDCDDIDKMLALEQRFFLSDHNLLYTDKMSMAAGVEVRVPLLDNTVVEFANSLPSQLKQNGRIGKWIFKKAMEPLLPNDVIYRPKTGFGAPLRRWIDNDLRGLVDEVLSISSLQERGIFDPNTVRSLIERTRSGRIDGSYTIFSLLCIELWFRKFVDKALERNGSGAKKTHS